MKVKDLIEKLQQFDPEMEVFVGNLNPEMDDPDPEPARTCMRTKIYRWPNESDSWTFFSNQAEKPITDSNSKTVAVLKWTS